MATASTTVFTIKYQYFHFARVVGLLLETQMQRFAHWKVSCVCGSGGVWGSWRYFFVPFLQRVVSFDCFWFYWELTDRRFLLCLFIFCHFVCWRWSGRITWCCGFSFKHRTCYFYHINLQSAIQLCWFLNDWEWWHWPCSWVLTMSWRASSVYLQGLWISHCPREITLCSTVQQISTGTVMGKKVPVFLYPQGQEGNTAPVSLDDTLLAWKDKGIRPLAARLAQLHW